MVKYEPVPLGGMWYSLVCGMWYRGRFTPCNMSIYHIVVVVEADSCHIMDIKQVNKLPINQKTDPAPWNLRMATPE